MKFLEEATRGLQSELITPHEGVKLTRTPEKINFPKEQGTELQFSHEKAARNTNQKRKDKKLS